MGVSAGSVGGISTVPVRAKVGRGDGCGTYVAVTVGSFSGSFVIVGGIIVCVGNGRRVIVGALVLMVLVSEGKSVEIAVGVARWRGSAVPTGLAVGVWLGVDWTRKNVGLTGRVVKLNEPVFKFPLICNVSFHKAEPTGITTIVSKAMITIPIIEITFRLSAKRLNTSIPKSACYYKIRLINVLIPSEIHPSFGMTRTSLPFN